MNELELTERVAQELYDEAILNIKVILRISNAIVDVPKYDDISESAKERYMSSAIKLIALVHRES